MPGIFDTHAHLNDKSLQKDIPGAIRRAAEHGVNRVICPGYNLATSRSAAQIAAEYKNVWASVGVHPHDSKHFDDVALRELRHLAEQPKVVAIGEIGLDYYRDLSPRPVQESVFRMQTALAKELGLPIIIHNRDAGADILRILKNEGVPEAGGVLHCFSEDADYALDVIEMGFYIGIAGPVTFSKSTDLREAVKAAPIERILVETDSPYLTPEPFRGRRQNEPALVHIVAQKVAEIRNLDVADLAKITTDNALKLFSKIGGG